MYHFSKFESKHLEIIFAKGYSFTNVGRRFFILSPSTTLEDVRRLVMYVFMESVYGAVICPLKLVKPVQHKTRNGYAFWNVFSRYSAEDNYLCVQMIQNGIEEVQVLFGLSTTKYP